MFKSKKELKPWDELEIVLWSELDTSYFKHNVRKQNDVERAIRNWREVRDGFMRLSNESPPSNEDELRTKRLIWSYLIYCVQSLVFHCRKRSLQVDERTLDALVEEMLDYYS